MNCGIGWEQLYNSLQNEIVIDNNGYERDGFGILVHRKVAWEKLYNRLNHPNKFGSYDVHHKDRNKRNNSPDNLEILTREEHRIKHGLK